MKQTGIFAVLGAVALLATPAFAQNTVINFDELPDPGPSAGFNGAPLPVPYHNITFTSVGYYNQLSDPDLTTGASSGEQAGIVNNFVATATNTAGKFNFLSAFLSAPLNAPGFPTSVTVNGLNGMGATIFTQVLSLDSTVTLYNFDYTGITTLELDVVNPVSIDDFTFNTSFGTTFSTMPGLTPNERGPATQIDNATAGTPNAAATNIATALAALPAGAVPGALDELTPVTFGNWASVTAINNASFETQAMDDYLASQRNGPNGSFAAGSGELDTTGLVVNSPNADPTLSMIHSRLLAWDPSPASAAVNDSIGSLLGGVDMKDMKEVKGTETNPLNFFVRGNVILAQGYSQADVPHFDDNTESVVIGADYRITPHFLVGVDASYAHTDVTLDDFGSSATVDSYSPGIYASYAYGGWYADFNANYLRNNYSQDRQIAFLGQAATSSPTGNEGTGNLDGGYDFHFGHVTVGPLAGFQYTHLVVNSYDENNSDASLDVSEQQADSLRSRLGFNFRYDMHCGDTTITPRLTATWQHEFLEQDRGITSQFSQFGGGEFVARTPNADDDSALVDAGIDATFNRSITLYVDYMVQAGQDDYFGQSVQGGVKIGF